MEPKHLVQLAVILEKGSITAAAEHLLVTQPTLTRNMSTLEMQAGGALFIRSRFGVRSTPLGETLAREGRFIARQIMNAEESASRHKLGFHNQLRVGVGPL
ncbi:MAG: LysR family transcriptional regulator, partial [Thiolinea sp.]